MSSSSRSDSDSDKEPNSHGARVFWGNVKTPERSRSNFVNPPKTIVKSSKLAHPHKSTRISLPMQDNTTDGRSQDEAVEDDGCTPNPARLNDDLVTGTDESAIDLDIERRDAHQPRIEPVDPDEGIRPTPLPVASSQSLLIMLKARISDTGSESEVEDAPVLQISSPVDPPPMLSDDCTRIETCESQDEHITARSKSVSPVSNLPKFAAHCPRPSQLPDLISFDIPIPTRLSAAQSGTHSTLHSDATANQPTSSSSCATIDDLLTLSPEQTQRQGQSRSPDHIHSSETQPDVCISTPSQSDDLRLIDQLSSGQHSTPLDHISSPVIPPTGLSHSPSEPPPHKSTAQTDNLSGKVEIVTNTGSKSDDVPHSQSTDEIDTQTPKSAGILPRTPSAETRKRTTTSPRKGKEKADGGSGSSGESSANDSNGKLDRDDQAADRAAKKERRAKAKQEAGRRRPLLMSLSPTSANVLNLLASPSRASLSVSSATRAIGDVGCESTLINIPSPFKAPATPQAGPSTPARRVPITITSPQRSDGPPLHLVQPNPVPLGDPNRSPARRVPLPTSSQTLSRPLPLDDPNRTPARRVLVPVSSPTRRGETTATPRPQSRQVERSHVASGSASPVKSTTRPLPPMTVEPPKGHELAFSSPSSRLPFPIEPKSPGGDKPSVDSSGLPSLPAAASSPLKPSATSSLKQPSSASASKIARVGNKPYSRPGYLQSRLPKPSSRLPVPSGGLGPSSAGLSRTEAPSAAAPTRIPSPVKRQTPNVDNPEPPPAAPSTSGPRVTTTYRRKRQRMIVEDSDSDEPPAKRPVIAVRQVKRGMYNKTALTDPAIPGTSTHKEASPVRLARPGPIQIRPVIPGTLGHFETTRSSSRDLFKNTEGSHTADPDRDATVVGRPSTPPREESPVADTDTASTVTTLSREPTLEEVPTSSSVLGPEPSFTTLAESGPELRRTTRVRKPYGPDAPTTPSAYGSTTRRDPLSLTRTTSTVQRGAASSSKASKSTTRTVKSPGIPTNPRQLQALTQANTVRNQMYIADLQRKIVRKYGPRPASPTTKVRTIMEKAKEETAKGREARAERRRRRGEGSAASTNSEGDSVDDFKSSSPPRELVDNVADKHARGPGDEEEYETPVRAPKPSRLDPAKITKNVKWDRGLARSISEFAAEQAAKRSREGAAAEAIRKGCLARDPHTLRLDPLGNVPDANIPLDDLGIERVIVTRFVYDDDDDIEATRLAKRKS